MLWIIEEDGAVIMNVLLQPRASKNELVGIHGDCLKIKVTSPPVENKANKKLCEYLSGLIGISKSKIEVVKGEKMRIKKVKISDSTLAEVRKKLSLD
ncbi:MAG: YggU family protein [Deltaproteobacteria bacterium]|nr:YggU family protein [Deltaproteobacteria bacterium]